MLNFSPRLQQAAYRSFGSRAVARWTSLLVGAVLATACGSGSDPFHISNLWVMTDVVVTDLDGDGRRDVLTIARHISEGSPDQGVLTVYRQTMPGHFTMETYVVGANPWRISVADIDGDDAPDVAIVESAIAQAPGHLWLIRQDPAQRGRLLSAQSLVETHLASTVAIADLNGDGVPDLALDDNVVVQGGNGVTVLYQNKSARGTFGAPVIVASPGQAGGIAGGDIDNDGRADLAISVSTSPPGTTPPSLGALGVLHQNTDGTLVAGATFAPSSGLNNRRLAVRDADLDGYADLMQFLTPCCTPPASLMLVLQGPVGVYRAVATPLSDIAAEDAAFGDFDGDGRVDAAVVGGNSPTQVTLMRQGTDGRFTPTTRTSLPAYLPIIAAGDIDGDGRVDLAVAGQDNQAWILLQVPGQPGNFAAPRRLP